MKALLIGIFLLVAVGIFITKKIFKKVKHPKQAIVKSNTSFERSYYSGDISSIQKEARDRRKKIYGNTPPLFTMFGTIGNPHYWSDKRAELNDKK
jgi:hypothetical protein